MIEFTINYPFYLLEFLFLKFIQNLDKKKYLIIETHLHKLDAHA
jgi:hypothetical protein